MNGNTETMKATECIQVDNREEVSPEFLCTQACALVGDPVFMQESSRAPVAIRALARVVVDKIILQGKKSLYFDGLTMTVPASNNMYHNPQYHSIVGQKILNVDWKEMYGLDVNCPGCNGHLINQRSNFSKNKILFPVFGLDGPPLWCIVRTLKCADCLTVYKANSGEILAQLPAYAAASYPVEPKYALSKNSHLHKSATNVFDFLLTTYGNGDLCSRLLYNSVNRAYLDRVTDYYSYCASTGIKATAYVAREGGFIKAFPPVGDFVRDCFDEAARSSNNPWGICDNERCTHEIQSVSCSFAAAEDHTHQVTKNYYQRKEIGAIASGTLPMRADRLHLLY